jgi:hypothetical protein
MAVSSRPHGSFFYPGPPGLLLHSIVEQALLGHSILHHERSAEMSKGNSFLELCPSGMHAYSSSLPMYFMKDIGWDPIKDIRKFDEFYFFQKISNISCINTLGKPIN